MPTQPEANTMSNEPGTTRVYTLEVFLVRGPVTQAFAKKNPIMARKFQIRGDQTLAVLHKAIFNAYNRHEEHLYEFQFGNGPMDPKGARYSLPDEFGMDEENPLAGRVDETTIDSLSLEVPSCFGYVFDFGDYWFHQINVDAIDDIVPDGKFPKLIASEGKSPPQHRKR